METEPWLPNCYILFLSCTFEHMGQPKQVQKFKESLIQKEPNHNWSRSIKALWWDAKGHWDRAHNLVDGYDTLNANAVHAYLHRKEGDDWNANYWYGRSKRPFFKGSLDQEWQILLEEFLNTGEE